MLSNRPHPVADFKHRLRVSKAIMPVRRRRAKLPRKVPPRSIALSYYRAISPILERARQAIERALEPLLPGLERQAAEVAARRNDADVNETLDRVGATIAAGMKPAEIAALAERYARATSDWEREQAAKQTRAAFGVDVLAREPNIAARSSAFVSENVALIKSIPAQYLADVEKRVARAVASGATPKELAAEIAKAHQVADDRAMLIARDQIGKYYGAVAQARQQAMGVTHYVWRTSNDERVREEHAAREGEVFAWNDPPEDGNPGSAINCRCYGEPILDQLLEGDEPHAEELASRGSGDEPAPESAPAPEPEVAAPTGPSEADLAEARAAHAAEVERRLAEQEAARVERVQAAAERARLQAEAEDHARRAAEAEAARVASEKAAAEVAARHAEELAAAKKAQAEAEARAAVLRSPTGAPLAEAHRTQTTPFAAKREAQLEAMRSRPTDADRLSKALALTDARGTKAQAAAREELDRIVAAEGARRSFQPDLGAAPNKAITVDGKQTSTAYRDWSGEIAVRDPKTLERASDFFRRVAAGEDVGAQFEAGRSARAEYDAAVREADELKHRYLNTDDKKEKRALQARYNDTVARANALSDTVTKHHEVTQAIESANTLVHETMHGHSPVIGSGSYVRGTGGVVVEEVATELSTRLVMERQFGVKDGPVGRDYGDRRGEPQRAYDTMIQPLTHAAAEEASRLGVKTSPDEAYGKLKNSSLAVKQDHTQLARNPREAVDIMLRKMSAEYHFTPEQAVAWEEKMRATVDKIGREHQPSD